MAVPSSEQAAVRQVIRAMKGAGAVPVALDNGAYPEKVEGLGERALLALMFQTDSDALTFRGASGEVTASFVYGNSPEETLADWWPAKGALNDVLEALGNDWFESSGNPIY